MRNPLDEVTRWLQRQRVERSMTVDFDSAGALRVTLYYPDTAGDEQVIECTGPTLDDALIAALDKLPHEVRR